MRRLRPAVLRAALRAVSGLAVTAGALAITSVTSAGCFAPADDYAADSASNLTLTDGAKFVVSASTDKVVLKTTTGDCTGCSLLETLVQDSKNKIESLDDLEGKIVLVHPIAKKAENGAFLRVTHVSKRGDRLTLSGTSVGLDEIDGIDEDDVVRIYMDRTIPVASGSRSGTGTGSGSTARSTSTPLIDTGLAPAAFGLAESIKPLTVSGVLVGDAPTFIVWKNAAPQIDFLGFLTPYITDTSFRPQVKAAWRKGSGLEIGLQMDFEEEAGLSLKGILGGNAELFKQSVETPNVMMLVPGALALPFSLTFSASFQCNAVTGGQLDINYKNRIKIHAGGSAVIDPKWDQPAADWVKQGEWPFDVSGTSTGTLDRFEAAPSVGIVCMVRLSANFAPKWFPMGGLFIALTPSALLVQSNTDLSVPPKPSYSVSLSAGAWTKNNLAVEATLLRWTP